MNRSIDIELSIDPSVDLFYFFHIDLYSSMHAKQMRLL
jgi:hypothetical protein